MLMQTEVEAQKQASFRIETSTFRVGNDTPLSTNKTLCDEGVFYDFLYIQDELEEIVIYDPMRHEFKLLNVQKKIRTEISEDEILQALIDLKSLLIRRNSAHLAEPDFKASFQGEDKTGVLTLTNNKMNYTVSGVVETSKQRTNAYFAFADWFTRLKATNPANFPPFIRLAVNKSLRKNDLIPKKVTVIQKGIFGTAKSELESRHTTNWLIGDNDRKQIDAAQDKIVSFEQVSIVEYHRNRVSK